MPFIALNPATGKRIDITQYEQPKRDLNPDEVVCQLCNQAMRIKDGPVVRAHFAHIMQCTNTEYQAHPESYHHDLGKHWIAEQLRGELWKYTNATIELEVPIPEIKRVADILVTFPNGWRIAHECQLADLGLEELQQRTEDYNRAGIDVFWWLGKVALTRYSKWVFENYGYILSLRFN
jgi:competence protein CoiA